MRRTVIGVLFVALVAVAGVGGAVVVGSFLDDGSDPATGEFDARPDDQAALVAGSVDRLALMPTLLDPLSAPVTIEPRERGKASARITPVIIDGREQSVSWPGGTPITLRSPAEAASLTLEPVPVEVSSEGVAVDLDTALGQLTPGTWTIEGSVAVGQEGFAQPADTVTFEALEATTVTFAGPALTTLPPDPLALEGPGTVLLTGDVEVTTEDADRRVPFLSFGPGPYRFDLIFVGDHLEVEGRLEGPIRFEPPGSDPTPGA